MHVDHFVEMIRISECPGFVSLCSMYRQIIQIFKFQTFTNQCRQMSSCEYTQRSLKHKHVEFTVCCIRVVQNELV